MSTATKPAATSNRSPAVVYDVVDGMRLHRLAFGEDMAGGKARHVLWPALSSWLGERSGLGET